MSRKNGKNSYSLLTNPNKKAYFDVIGYKPEQIQWDVHNSKARFRVNIQGRRSGKSYSASREAEVAILQPNTRGWIVAPSYELASKIGREIHENLIIKYKFPTISKKVINGNLFYAKFINGSEVWVKSAGTPDTSLVGEGLDWLIIDESAIINKLVGNNTYDLLYQTDKGGLYSFQLLEDITGYMIYTNEGNLMIIQNGNLGNIVLQLQGISGIT